MASFKLYLPSNASHHHFPNNTSSHYQTQLHEPIHLEGKWEVAAESIYYSANIGDEKETAGIYFSIKAKEARIVNDVYDYSFKVSPENTWLGFRGVTIPMRNTVSSVIQDLNNANATILSHAGHLFKFKFENDRVTYTGESPSFTLEIHTHVARAIGFPEKISFSGQGPFTGNRVTDDTFQLEPRVKKLHYFHHLITERKKRINVKLPGEEFDEKLFVAMWNERVRPHIHCVLSFNKGKTILDLFDHDVGIILCPALGQALDQAEPLLQRVTRWSYKLYKPTPSMKKEHWFVDIHSDNLARTYVTRYRLPEFIFRPRLFSTTAEVINFLNDGVKHKLKDELGDMYDEKKHSFQLTPKMYKKKKQRVQLDIGPWLELSWSSTLSHMLGFEQQFFDKDSHQLSTLPPAALRDRTQRVLLMSDFIQPVSYGNKQLTVLQDFIHEVKGRDIIEKRFHPLSYVPIIRNFIDTITVKLVNEDETSITARDVKTVVVLHFRRVQ